MKKLLSLPPNVVGCFHQLERLPEEEYFCTSDPVGRKLGSGGGTVWLLQQCQEHENPQTPFDKWISNEKRILLHAGGQSRRLPAYAPCGKSLTPIPVFRWKRGQRITQNLMQLQLPLFQHILEVAPESCHTLIASGDVYIESGRIKKIPEADVVCFGIWADTSLIMSHGAFCMKRQTPERLDFMLQKPSADTLSQLTSSHMFLMDVGIWLLSDRAVNALRKKCVDNDGNISNYDLYGEFGCCLGDNPKLEDSELAHLTTAVLPLPQGKFYHYGTSREMISSTVSIQNKIFDQRSIIHLQVKPHPSIFIQNAVCNITFTADNENTWVENSYISPDWRLEGCNIITGVPENDWNVRLGKGVCVDVVPVNSNFGEGVYALRPYGFDDPFRGCIADASTIYLSKSITEWQKERGLGADSLPAGVDIQAAPLFPLSQDIHTLGKMLTWMVDDPTFAEGREAWLSARRLSADELSIYADLPRLQQQREGFLKLNLLSLSFNHKSSVFYQTNLMHMADLFARYGLPMPEELGEGEPLLKRIGDQQFRACLSSICGEKSFGYESKAFSLLAEGLTQDIICDKQMPRMNVCPDQMVCSSSPVRIDLAGGWTDTPPYCLFNGGRVVNIAIDLNGQQPLHAYVKASKDYSITIRSIDLGASERVDAFEQLRDFSRIGSPFSIPKAALSLSGFIPEFCRAQYRTLKEQLQDFGCGMEVIMLSTIPAGSGLGTSSILSAIVLGALSDFCGLHWDREEICRRTLVLEQLLTAGGGWQDQYGGVLPGIKMLSTDAGFSQTPETRWTGTSLYTDSENSSCHLLYYTGITRTAKNILSEIVRGMFLHNTETLRLLDEMKEHAFEVYESLQICDLKALGGLVRKTWKQNQALDAGTNPDCIRSITSLIDDLCLGYKLPGAGGGGYLYMIAKDPQAAVRIRRTLTENAPNANARFADMTLDTKGMLTSRS